MEAIACKRFRHAPLRRASDGVASRDQGRRRPPAFGPRHPLFEWSVPGVL